MIINWQLKTLAWGEANYRFSIVNYQLSSALKCHLKHQSYTIPIGGREIEIVESAYILNAEELEDIIYTDREFGIRTVRVHNRTTFREFHQQSRILILLKKWIVLVGYSTPESLEADNLTPLQFLEQRHTIEPF